MNNYYPRLFVIACLLALLVYGVTMRASGGGQESGTRAVPKAPFQGLKTRLSQRENDTNQEQREIQFSPLPTLPQPPSTLPPSTIPIPTPQPTSARLVNHFFNAQSAQHENRIPAQAARYPLDANFDRSDVDPTELALTPADTAPLSFGREQAPLGKVDKRFVKNPVQQYKPEAQASVSFQGNKLTRSRVGLALPRSVAPPVPAGTSPDSDKGQPTRLASVTALSEPQPTSGASSASASRSEPGIEPSKQPATTQPTAPTTTKPGGPASVLNAKDFRLATQPEAGAHYYDARPATDRSAWIVDYQESDFGPTPLQPHLPYDPEPEKRVYDGKTLNAVQRPLLEIGRPFYQLGQFAPPKTYLGEHNPVTPQLLVYGDYRSAFASNDLQGDDTTQLATQLNLFVNWKITSTERFVTFINPLGQVKNTRYEFDDGGHFISEFDADFDIGYFEGDLGAIVGGFIGESFPFDLPFAVGLMPLVIQNGVWLEDALAGVAVTIPARNSPRFDISNMDITFFLGVDEIDSPAFEGDDDVAKMWGVFSFIEAMNGYWEVDYAFLEDRSFRDRSYHNIGLAFTRRYGRFISNSTRVIVNAGQSTSAGPNTADGVLLLSENSLITGSPTNLVPYFNMFAGFDRPQSAARAAAAGGVLRNTGILFESDNLTGYPTLDATANDTFGAALGVNIMPTDLTQQLILEVAGLGTIGDDPVRNARGSQFGAGYRYQLPLTNSIIFRTDGMFGWLGNENDIHGFRMELRKKF